MDRGGGAIRGEEMAHEGRGEGGPGLGEQREERARQPRGGILAQVFGGVNTIP